MDTLEFFLTIETILTNLTNGSHDHEIPYKSADHPNVSDWVGFIVLEFKTCRMSHCR